MEHYGTTRQNADDNTAGRMPFACQMTKARMQINTIK